MTDRIILSLPSTGLSVNGLTSTLRLFELLVALRGISPAGQLSPTWPILYQRFIQSALTAALDRQGRFIFPNFSLHSLRASIFDATLDSEYGVDSTLFESWTSAEFVGLDLLPIDEIRSGSYELFLQTVNLVAIFGLQDYGVIKDLVQWVCGALKDMLGHEGGTEHVVKSGNASVRISPELIRALHPFDSVVLTEERTTSGTTLKIKLTKRDK